MEIRSGPQLSEPAARITWGLAGECRRQPFNTAAATLPKRDLSRCIAGIFLTRLPGRSKPALRFSKSPGKTVWLKLGMIGLAPPSGTSLFQAQRFLRCLILNPARPIFGRIDE